MTKPKRFQSSFVYVVVVKRVICLKGATNHDFFEKNTSSVLLTIEYIHKAYLKSPKSVPMNPR